MPWWAWSEELANAIFSTKGQVGMAKAYGAREALAGITNDRRQIGEGGV